MGSGIAIWQVIILTIYSMYQIMDELTLQTSLSQPIWAGDYCRFSNG